MTFATLTLVVALGLLGPFLGLGRHWRLPVLIGEIAAGFFAGPGILGWLDPHDATFAFLATVGFALVMFVAGTHVPVNDVRLRQAIRVGLLRAALVGVVAVPAGFAVAAIFGTGHAATYAVVLASSSAALVLPTIDSVGLTGPHVIEIVPQVAIADVVCIAVLQIAIQPSRAAPALLAVAIVISLAIALFFGLRWLERSGIRRRVHRVSQERKFALEMRFNLVLLFGLAAVALWAGVSVLLAGFAFGLAVAGVGEPRRLARQVFALTEGFLGPLFFVWLGASLSTAELFHHPSYVILGLTLGVVAIAVHLVPRVIGQPISLGALAAAQLGVPVAAATIGTQQHLLTAGEGAALVIGALVTVAASVLGAVITARAAAA